MPAEVRRVVERIGENCEPSLCTVLFLAGAGGSLRAGVTENPVLLTRSIKDALVNVTCGGAPVYVWPGGGITVMVDVRACRTTASARCRRRRSSRRSSSACGASDYRALGGHMDRVRRLEEVLARGAWQDDRSRRRCAAAGRSGAADARGRFGPAAAAGLHDERGAAMRRLDDGRWHFNHGPIDIVADADGDAVEVAVGASSVPGGASPRMLDELVAELPLLRTDLARRRRRCAAARPDRAPHVGGLRAASAPASSRRWPRSPARGAGADRLLPRSAASSAPGSTTAATSRCTSAPGSRARRLVRRPARASDLRRRPARRHRHRRPVRARIAAQRRARRRHQRLARPQLLARHRRQRDGAGGDRGRRPMPRPR